MATERTSRPGRATREGQEPKEDDVPKPGFTFTEMPPAVLAQGAPSVRGGSHEMMRELCSLGLTREASLGILKLLVQGGSRPAGDPAEW